MNSERLRATVDQLLDVERRFGIQGILQQLMNEMQQLIQNPGHQQFQTQYAATLQSLKRKWAEMAAAFSPAERKIIAEVKGEPFFLDGLPDEVEAIARDNPLTPAVTQQKIHEVFSRRQDYLAALGELQNRMKVLGIEAYPLESGQAEIGFLLPREL